MKFILLSFFAMLLTTIVGINTNIEQTLLNFVLLSIFFLVLLLKLKAFASKLLSLILSFAKSHYKKICVSSKR
ncbi:hypothetical protein [Hydrogenimonas thermophila]|uniref:hypothetical protein n=1 Tax=Hydrogenimonas thermophila TaxID=223786 RepID=UPI001160CB66|nr:hypothetical protein [Hydrogenimonas thermophila]